MNVGGWVLSGLAAVFLLFDAVAKLAGAPSAVQTTVELGFAAPQVRSLGVLLLILTLLYLLPRTSVLGAVLLTGYLGGTVAVHFLNGSPLPSHTLFGVYVGVMLWGGLYLRLAAVRELIPFIRLG